MQAPVTYLQSSHKYNYPTYITSYPLVVLKERVF